MLKGNKGAALLLVLMITAVMASIMMIMLNQNQYQAKLSNLIKQNSNTRLELRSIQSEVLFELLNSGAYLTGSDKSKVITNFQGSTFKFNQADVSISDRDGLISLRPVNERGLIELLQLNNVKTETIRLILNRIEDWTDKDKVSKGEQGERVYGQPFLPPNQAFSSINELDYIFSGYENVLAAIKPYLSMYTSSVTNKRLMKPELFQRLYPNQRQSDILSGSEFQSQAGDGFGNVTSGRFRVEIVFNNEQVTLKRSFELSKGLGMNKPFYVTNEKYQ